MQLDVLYRGPLSSCNYGCEYCPFAKRVDSREDMLRDRRALERFEDWVLSRTEDRIGVFFTPWGEALIRPAYRCALVKLSRAPNVRKVAIQTNLSCDVAFAEAADPTRLALWATFHPEWSDRAMFLEKVRALRALGVTLSVGVVGFPKFISEIESLRDELPSDVYLWVNAVKSGGVVYADDEVLRISRVDPLFAVSLREHPSLGRACRTGASVISVDGNGDVRRCHFVRDVIGNLYDGSFEHALRERPCPNATCGCHIGYVHLDELGLYASFGEGVLERVPAPGVRRLPRATLGGAQ